MADDDLDEYRPSAATTALVMDQTAADKRLEKIREDKVLAEIVTHLKKLDEPRDAEPSERIEAVDSKTLPPSTSGPRITLNSVKVAPELVRTNDVRTVKVVRERAADAAPPPGLELPRAVREERTSEKPPMVVPSRVRWVLGLLAGSVVMLVVVLMTRRTPAVVETATANPSAPVAPSVSPRASASLAIDPPIAAAASASLAIDPPIAAAASASPTQPAAASTPSVTPIAPSIPQAPASEAPKRTSPRLVKSSSPAPAPAPTIHDIF